MFPNPMRTLSDFQEFHHWFDAKNRFRSDVSLNMILLTGEVDDPGRCHGTQGLADKRIYSVAEG